MVSEEAQFNMILGDMITKKKYAGDHYHNKAIWYPSKSILLLLQKHGEKE